MRGKFLPRPRTVLASLGTMLCVATGVIGHPVYARAAPDNCPATAAAAYQWGAPNKADDFDGPSSLAGWNLYDGPGHDGNGRRTPSAVSVADGVLTITGDSQGNSEGMSWSPGQTYGRWEVCVKSPAASPNYHSVLLLWPARPGGGEVDFMEIADPTRQSVDAFVHYGSDQQVAGHIRIDATQWHSWAVEWSSPADCHLRRRCAMVGDHQRSAHPNRSDEDVYAARRFRRRHQPGWSADRRLGTPVSTRQNLSNGQRRIYAVADDYGIITVATRPR